MSYDLKDGSLCRPPDPGFDEYELGTPFTIGEDAEDGACLVKYQITNKNTVHDMRI